MAYINEKLIDQMATELERNTFHKDNYKELSVLSFMEHLNLAKKQLYYKRQATMINTVYLVLKEQKVVKVAWCRKEKFVDVEVAPNQFTLPYQDVENNATAVYLTRYLKLYYNL